MSIFRSPLPRGQPGREFLYPLVFCTTAKKKSTTYIKSILEGNKKASFTGKLTSCRTPQRFYFNLFGDSKSIVGTTGF